MPSDAPEHSAVPIRPSSVGAHPANYLVMLVVLAVLIGLFSLASRRFLSVQNFAAIANQNADLIVIAVGMTFVLLVAGIDLSVGSVMALAGSLLGVTLVDWHVPLLAAIPLAVLAGLVCGMASGLVSVWCAIPSFIVTLGMLEIARGGAFLVTGEQTKYIGAAIAGISAPRWGTGLSLAFFAAVGVVIAAQLVLTRTVFGRYVMAIGYNELAVKYSGIDPRPVKLAVFALSGALAGLGGVFHASKLSSADPNAGVGLELAAIAAVVIGGTSLMGGRGSVVSSFLGVLIIAVLQTGLAHIGASEPTKRVITGAVIVVAVIIDALRTHLATRKR